jgi:hypothetical protein
VYYLNKLISAPSVLFGKVDLATQVTFFFFCVVFQFLNKVLHSREGAKSMIDRTFVDLLWQVRLEVYGAEIDILEV